MEELTIFLVIYGTLLGAFGAAAVLVWFERRLLGFWQDRLGPNRVGPFGIGLALADVIKLLAKEELHSVSIKNPSWSFDFPIKFRVLFDFIR